MGRALGSRSKGLGFHFHCLCWTCVKVSGKLLIPLYLCLLSSGGYLVDENCTWVAQAACILVWCALYSPRGNEIAWVPCARKVMVGLCRAAAQGVVLTCFFICTVISVCKLTQTPWRKILFASAGIPQEDSGEAVNVRSFYFKDIKNLLLALKLSSACINGNNFDI